VSLPGTLEIVEPLTDCLDIAKREVRYCEYVRRPAHVTTSIDKMCGVRVRKNRISSVCVEPMSLEGTT